MRLLPARLRRGVSPDVLPRMSPILLIAGLLLVAAALYQAWAAVRSHRETSERLIRDYGAFAAWSYSQYVAAELRALFHGVLQPVVHPVPPAAAGTLTAANWQARRAQADTSTVCGRACEPQYFFRIPLQGSGDAELAGEPPDSATAALLVAAVRAHAGGPESRPGDFTMLRVGDRLIVYALAGTSPDARVAYGFEVEGRRYAPLFQRTFTRRKLLPGVATESRDNEALLGMQVIGPSGDSYYTSSDPEQWTRPSIVVHLDEQFARLEVRSAVRQQAVGPLTGGSFERARLPLIAALLAMASGLAVIAVYQMRRDAELARMRSDFVSSVSHELRTPLAQVQLFLETLRLGRYRTDEQREWILDNLHRETTRLATLVENVLHFSRNERGAAGGAREPVMLEQYLSAVISDFEPLAATRGVRIETSLEPGLVAQLDTESFRQVLLNVLDNAVKYGPKGQVVRVSSSVAGGRIRICVEDEGPGVEPRERESIFEPFRRGEKAVGSVAVGSGIGLSVARDIVQRHNGTIWVESAPGGGARFVIELDGWRQLDNPEARVVTSEAVI